MISFTLKQFLQLVENTDPMFINNDHIPVVKFYMPGTKLTWLFTRFDENDATLMFGLYDLGVGIPELGYVDQTEVNSMRSSKGERVKRDEFFDPKFPLSVYARAAYALGHITESDELLAKYIPRRPPGFRPN